jgi:hypothetical protein
MPETLERKTKRKATGKVNSTSCLPSSSPKQKTKCGAIGSVNATASLPRTSPKESGDGQRLLVPQTRSAAPDSQTNVTGARRSLMPAKPVPPSREHCESDRRTVDTLGVCVASQADLKAGEDQRAIESHWPFVFPAFLKLYRDWTYMRRTQFGLDNTCGALARSALGWKYADGNKAAEKANGKIRKTADALVKSIVKGGKSPAGLEAVADAIRPVVMAYQSARDQFDSHVSTLEKLMIAELAKLSVAAWCKTVRGFGAGVALVRIIGETGDLSNYANPAKVWKRLGLAPHNGKAYSEWRKKGGLTGQEWVEAGYKPSRRSSIHVVGDTLLKGNKGGKYRAKYDARKAHTAATHPDWTKGHQHADALRVMEKELVKDLWKEWGKGKATVVLSPLPDVPASPPPNKEPVAPPGS